MKILPLSDKINRKLEKYKLSSKFQKQIKFLTENPNHPSLNVELLKPSQYGIYSFRIDKKYRALFIFRPDLNAIEILNITLHYK